MKVSVLPLIYRQQDKDDVLYPVLLQHGSEVVLVDCGYEETVPQLVQTLQKEGYTFSDLTGIVLTHHDIDHVGGAYAIKKSNPTLTVYASPVEANWINGYEKPLRLQQAEDIYACLPEDQKAAALAFQAFLQTVKPITVDFLLEEGKSWPLAEYVEIISTPGHTPGHVSLYVKAERTLIASDAVVIEEEGLNIANPQYAINLPEAIASVEKISRIPAN